MIAFYRVEGPHARLLLKGLQSRSAKGQALFVDVENKFASPAPFGQAPKVDQLVDLRARLKEFVFAGTEPVDAALHRSRLGLFLHDEAGLSESDAGQPAVWNYLAMVLLPDVMERTGARLDTTDHFLARDLMRHRLARYWRRDRVLGEFARGRASLAEDEMVQLTERTALARNSTLVRVMCEQLETVPARGRETLTRHFARSVTARTGAVLADALSENDLRELVREEFARTRQMLSI